MPVGDIRIFMKHRFLINHFLFSTQVGNENGTMSCVTDLLHRVPHKDDIIPMEFEIDPAKFIPGASTQISFSSCFLHKNVA